MHTYPILAKEIEAIITGEGIIMGVLINVQLLSCIFKIKLGKVLHDHSYLLIISYKLDNFRSRSRQRNVSSEMLNHLPQST